MIELGNFIFMIITKIYVVKVAGIVDKIVSGNQFGFIKGRKI